MAYFVGSTTVLAGDGVFTSATKLRERHDTVTGSVFAAGNSGTIYLEQSPDGTNWDISTSYAVTDGDGKGFSEALLLPFWRIRYVNGSGATLTSFRISATTQAGGDS